MTEVYDLEAFQKKVLEKYFEEHAPIGIRTRREAEKMTMEGAYAWIMSRAERLVDGDKNGCIVTENDFAYNEMMFYFTECKEGDTFRTEKEIKEDEEREAKRKIEDEKRKEQKKKDDAKKLVALRKEHDERVVRWATMTPEQIKCDIYRRKHSWHKDKTDEEILKLIEEDIKRKAEQEVKEAIRKEKEEKKKKKEEEKKRKEEMMKKWQEQQLTLF